MKHLKIIFLLLIAVMGAQTMSAHDFEVNGIYYNKNGTEATVTYKGDYANSYNEYTGVVIIPSTVTYAGTTYSVTSIGSEAFKDCTGLTSVTIPNSVTSIGKRAFYRCSGLTSLSIGKSVNSINIYAFESCGNLRSVTWNARTCENYSPPYFSPFYWCRCVNLSITFGEEVESIPAYLCSGVHGLTSVTFGNSVATIGNSAFSGCTGLTSVTIPNSVTRIGVNTFNGCSGLTSVNIGDSVTIIDDYAFVGCTGLTSVTIPNSVTSIGNYVFRGCTGLTSVIWNAISCFCNPDEHGYSQFRELTGIKTFTFGNVVERIPGGICKGCIGLTSVTIGNSVKEIGNNAFQGCTSLTNVTWNSKNISDFSSSNSPFYNVHHWIKNFTFGEEVERIPAYLCEGMYELTSVTIPCSVTTIGNSAFSGCSGLTSVTIPNSVTSIGSETFYRCSGLTTVTIGNSVTSIGESAFEACSGMTSVTIPCSVTTIGNSAFSGCRGLTSVTIPNSVTSIGSKTFYRCSGLTTVTIGNSVASIGYDAFYYSFGSGDTIYSLNPTPPISSSNIGPFDDECYKATLFVPIGGKTTYQTAKIWKKFKNIKETEYDGIDNVVIDQPINPLENLDEIKTIYTIDGRRLNPQDVSRLPNGIYIVNGKKILINR